MNLHKIPDYTTVQACVGGNPDTGNHIECFFEGNIDHTSKMVRLASIEAGGLVAVARKSCQSILCQTKLCHWWCQLCN